MVIIRPPHAVLYTRVSTQRQVDEGSSLATQDEALHALAKRKGWMVDHLFSDEGISGRGLTDRLAMQEALNYAEENLQKGDRFAVYSISRLARNTYDGLKALERLRVKGIVLCDVDKEYHDTPTDNLILNTQLSMAQFQSDDNKARTKVGMQRLRLEGRYQSGAPFGYRNGGSRLLPSLVVVPEEAEVVISAFERIIAGRTQTEVAYWVADNAVFQGSRKARGLGSVKMTVKRWLDSRTYVGFLVDIETGEEIRGDWEPIISEELWNLASEALSKVYSSGHIPHSSQPDKYPLKKVLQCPNCGNKFTGYVAKKKFPYYQCIGKSCSKRQVIPVELAHQQFEALLDGLIDTTHILAATLPQLESQALQEVRDSKARRGVIQKRIEHLAATRSDYLDALVSGKVAKVDFDMRDASLRDEIQEMSARLSDIPRLEESFVEEAVSSLHSLLDDPLAFWRDAPNELRPELALTFFPDRVMCEDKALRTTNFLGIARALVPSVTPESLVAPPTGFEPVPPP